MSFLPPPTTATKPVLHTLGLPMPYVMPLAKPSAKPTVEVKEDKPKAKPKNVVVFENPKATMRDELMMKGRLTAVERRKLSRLETNDRIAEFLDSKPKRSDMKKWFMARMAELAD